MTTPEQAAQTHDFRRSETFGPTQLHAVEAAFEAFARTGGAAQTTAFRHPFVLSLHTAREVAWEDLIDTLDRRMHSFIFSLLPLPGEAVLMMPSSEALAMVDLRLAGTGEEEYGDRELTEIEQELLSPVVSALLDELARGLAELQETKPALDRQEPAVRSVSVASQGDMCLAAHFSFTLANRQESEMIVCFPPSAVRHLAEVMRAGTGSGGNGTTAPGATEASRRLRNVPLDLILEFPSFVTTTEELLKLAIGDELHLGLPTDRPLEVRAEGVLVARATIGRSGVRKACAITEEVLQ